MPIDLTISAGTSLPESVRIAIFFSHVFFLLEID